MIVAARPEEVPQMKDGRIEADGGLIAERGYRALVERLRDGSLASGQFVSMPMLGEMLGFPIAAVREAVKRADTLGLVSVLPKRGVMVMSADAETTRHCLDFRAILDAEGARRAVEQHVPDPELDDIESSHRELLAQARECSDGDLSRRAIAIDLSLHDYLGSRLGNPLAAEVYAVNRHRVAIIQNTRPFLPARIVSAMEEHLAVIDALRKGDAEAAVAAVGHHHRQTLRWWGVA